MAASRSQISGYFRRELESSLEAEISMSNLPLYNIFVGKKKKKLPFWNGMIYSNLVEQCCQNCSRSIPSITMMLFVGTLNWSIPSLSSAEASLCCREAGEKEKEAPPLPFSHRPLLSMLRLLLFLMGYPAGASAQERGVPLKSLLFRT